MADRPHVNAELSRELTLFQITMMGLGMMIGAGVFIGIGRSVAEAGPGGPLLTFGLNGLLAIFTAMAFAELSSAIPRAGGAYNFARIAFGRGPSFLAGWMEWFASSVAGSLYAVVFATYTLEFLVQLGLVDWLPVPVTVARKGIAFAVASIFLYVNYRGASETGKVGAFFTLGQMLFMVSIAVAGAIVAVRDPSRFENLQPFLPNGWGKLLVTMGFTYVAFEGFEVIAQAGDEAIKPKQNIPKAMLYSVMIVTFTYVGVSFAAMVAAKAGSPGIEGSVWEWIASHGDVGFGKAVAAMMPKPFIGHMLVTLAVVFSSTSAMNATIYSATRASYALGRDRMLPPAFAAISARTQTPWVALTGTGVIVLAVAAFLPTTDVASSASIMFLSLFFLVNLCVIKIRRNMGDELDYGFIMPFFPAIPIIAIVCQVLLAVWLVHMSVVAWIIAPVWIGGGLLFYRFYSRKRAIRTEDEITVFEEEQSEREAEGDKVMVAVANPENALSMVRHTYHICRERDASVEMIHMVPVPEQVPLSDAASYMQAGKEAIGEVMLYLAPTFPFSSTIRYCRNVARGIVAAVREKKINMLIMGWHGQRRSGPFTLGSTIDPVIERVPCDVVIFKNCGDQKFKHVLVPLAGGPNSAFAFEVAGMLADKAEGRITALTVHSERSDELDIDGFVEANMGKICLTRDRIRTKVLNDRLVVPAILHEADDETEGYDLVVIGATRGSALQNWARHPVPETVAQMCNKPIVMVRASGGLRSWVRRWI